MTNNGSDGSKVKVHGSVEVKEDSLENSSWEFHPVLAWGVECICHSYKLVLDPGHGVDLVTKSAVVERVPEPEHLETVAKKVVRGKVETWGQFHEINLRAYSLHGLSYFSIHFNEHKQILRLVATRWKQ